MSCLVCAKGGEPKVVWWSDWARKIANERRVALSPEYFYPAFTDHRHESLCGANDIMGGARAELVSNESGGPWIRANSRVRAEVSAWHWPRSRGVRASSSSSRSLSSAEDAALKKSGFPASPGFVMQSSENENPAARAYSVFVARCLITQARGVPPGCAARDMHGHEAVSPIPRSNQV